MEHKNQKELEEKLIERKRELEIRVEISKYMEKIGYA